jgi:tetratricopeptide (TPR) repeat protein
VLLYELLIGSPPFDGGSLMKAGLDEIRRVIREREPDRPSMRLSTMSAADLTSTAQRRQSAPPALIRSVRGDLDWIVMKALEKDRRRRYETANGLALDVQRYMANEPISARPPSKLYKFQKTVLRNKLLFIGIGVIALLMVVGLIAVSAALAKERRSRLRSQQTTKFLEEMLKGVGPSAALGRDTTMLREILDQTAERVGKEMTDQPGVEAELRSLIGRLYRQIGNLDRAEEMDRAALAIRREQFGSESPETAASLNELGLALVSKNNLSEAEGADGEALAVRRRIFGEENADTATSLNDLGAVYREEGKLTEADAMAREALKIRQQLFGNESTEVADSKRNLCIILGDEGKWPESEAMARAVLAIRLKLLGPEHPWVAYSLDDVAWAAGAEGKRDEAEALERESLAMRLKLLGSEHPDAARSFYLLGDRMRQRGNLNEAYSFLSTALSIQRKRLDKENPALLATMRSMGLTLEAEGKMAEAEQLLGEALTPAFIKLPSSADLLGVRVEVMARQGRWQEAATDAALALEHQPSNPDRYHTLAPLLAITHNRPAYDQLCRRILAAFADTTNAAVADRMAKDCLLLPSPGMDLQLIGHLADTAVTVGKDNWAMPYFEVCKALSDYRQRHFADAIDWTQKALKRSNVLYLNAYACAVLAMADWQLGEKGAAREMLAKGNSLAPIIFPVHEAEVNADAWSGWIFARILLDEATALVESPAAGQTR